MVSRKLLSLAVVVLAIAIYWFVYQAMSDISALELMSVRGKRVLITGASSGIGEEVAYTYSRLGAIVLLTARREDLLKVVADKCRQFGAERVEYVAADMASPSECRRVVNETKKRLGGSLDHLILNHALTPIGPWIGAPENITTLRKVLQVNFISYVEMMSLCLEMLRASKGNVGVMSSAAGKLASPYTSSVYGANKFALQGFFSSLRQELKWTNAHISITLIVLGLINTDKAADNTFKYFPKIADWTMSKAVAVNETADFIVRAVISRAYEVTYPPTTWLLLQLHKLMPTLIEDKIGQTMHSQYKS